MKGSLFTYLATFASCLSIGAVNAQVFDPNKGSSEGWDPAAVGTNKTTNATFSNPVMTLNIGDPFMTRYTVNGEDWYLFTYTTNTNITLRRSRYLTDNWDNAESRVVFNPDANSGEPWSTSLWAPEIHNISGSWYIIFTATSDGDNPAPLLDAMCPINCPAINHRMFVLAGDGPDPWTANFEMKPMLDTYDMFAIDGTYFQHDDQLYHIYSCWEQKYSSWPANLCITRMSDPWTINSTLTERRIISIPNEPWEQVPYGRPIRLATNEGPQQLTNPKTGQNFVIYSAARVNTPFYCLGMLELVGDDPMEYQSWRKHTSGCVFHQNTAAGVYGTGHASFTSSPDGSESYIVYHAQTTANPAADLYRTARIQKFGWNEDGTPKFPKAENGPFGVPAGQLALTKQ
ncbi:glycoside hydrolase family 43 protein [Annulohypoxylon truncatum]|uniref:glycoside hydrolase family 43 protein n=1 Tax=Annulohypoxylon truncatum TaxID=327061 RepID=UPI002007D4BC|nr:glycoside hydrolase family 43 protein [Annulohypoxylon truncatum]KAI1205675.1 glycoside hydrolase family 43 protein [Annulohypoxylon truncatum]